MGLRSVEGIGERLETRILDEVGGEEGLCEVVDGLQIDRLSSVNGLGEERAVKVFRELLGLKGSGLASTERARSIRDLVIEEVACRARTRYGRNRARLLRTLGSPEAAERRFGEVEGFREMAESVPLEDARSLLDRVGPLEGGREGGGHTVVVEDEETYMEMLKGGLNRFCTLQLLSDRPVLNGEFAVYYYSERLPDLVDSPNVEPLRDTGEHWRAAPDSVISLYAENYGTLEATGRVLDYFGSGGACREAASTVDRLNQIDSTSADLDKSVRGLRDGATSEVYRELEDTSIEGREVLESLGREEGLPSPVAEVMEEKIRRAERELRGEFGLELSPFVKEFPLGIDEEELQRAKARLDAETASGAFERKVEAAERLLKLEGDVESEVREAMERDYQLAIGSFALERGLERPEFGETLSMRSALHLGLPGCEAVDYSLNTDAVLLTGANSGGKTTLLETVAQVVVLSHMGLPVPAGEAVVPWFDELHFYSPRNSMDAGSFETFLRDFLPLCGGDAERLILADELEAVTELEAAATILASFVDRLRETGSTCLLVTHMPEQIRSKVDVRIDGIEAEGLDEDGELVVDRSPSIGSRASSTPELILERLAREEPGLYGEFLEELRGS